MLIYKADFITQVSTLIHHGKRFPLSRLDVHLLLLAIIRVYEFVVVGLGSKNLL